MNKCGECALGVKQGAVCTNCEGTTFVVEQKVPVETTMDKVKKVVKKVVQKKK